MSGILIEPRSTVVRYGSTHVPVLEITLGGAPDGLIIVDCDTALPTSNATEVMNRLAENGYESLATHGGHHPIDVMVDRAHERGWTPEQIGMVGFGAGGRAVLAAATRLEFGAAVSMSAHPDAAAGCTQLMHSVHGALATPWLGLFGAEDLTADAASVNTLADCLNAGSDVHSQIVRYRGVGRQFYQQADQDGLTYTAWYDAWQRTIEWFGARVAPRLTPLATEWRSRR